MGKIVAYSFGGLMLFAFLLNTFHPDPQSSQAAASSTSETVRPVKDQVTAQLNLSYRWWTEGEILMKATFTITNKSDYPVKDIEITCTHFAESGTRIDSNTRTIYKLFPPHRTVRVPDFDMGFIHSQARQSACNIEEFALAN